MFNTSSFYSICIFTNSFVFFHFQFLFLIMTLSVLVFYLNSLMPSGSKRLYIQTNLQLLAEGLFKHALREKCPNMDFFLVCISPHSDWIRKVFSLNTGKYGPEKLRIWTLFTQWWPLHSWISKPNLKHWLDITNSFLR